MNVLILEDDMFAGKTIKMELDQDKSFNKVFLARSKKEAIALLKEKKIDVALLDIMLVKGNENDRQGVEFLKYNELLRRKRTEYQIRTFFINSQQAAGN